MMRMKRSDILCWVLIAVIIVLAVAAFALPQELLDNFEVLFLWVVMPLIG
ncbi:MAG: hypothetical protein ABI621_11965 [Chloroflexota bacterium]